MMRGESPDRVRHTLNGPGMICGYANVFNCMDAHRDVVRPNAFSKTLKDAMRSQRAPLMLLNHQWDAAIGVWHVLREDQRGLYVMGQLNMVSSAGRSVWQRLRKGASIGLSVGFRVMEWQPYINKDGQCLTLIEGADLIEVSVVDIPANAASRAVLCG